jgi:hypothetical protein
MIGSTGGTRDIPQGGPVWLTSDPAWWDERSCVRGGRRSLQDWRWSLLPPGRWESEQRRRRIISGREEGGRVSAVAISAGILLVVVSAVREVVVLLIRLRGWLAAERLRQVAVKGMLVTMPPRSIVVLEHPDGTTCMLARGVRDAAEDVPVSQS